MTRVKAKTEKMVSLIKSFLKKDKITFSMVSDDCIEIYIQANNVNLIILIYVVRDHVIIRTPEFVRNIPLKRIDVMSFIIQVMTDVLDIRFEFSEDYTALSASCQHIVEDNPFTKKQFDLMMTVLISITDDVYPQIMKIIYSGNNDDILQDNLLDDDLIEDVEHELDDELDDFDNHSDIDDDEHKIN